MATTLIIRTRVLRTGTTRPATLLMASSSVLDPGITGDIQLGSGIAATTATPTWATTGTMIAGPDADGTTTAMRIAAGATPKAVMCIPTRTMDSAVGKPSMAEAGSTAQAVFMVDAAKR